MFGKEADKEKRGEGDPTMHGDWCCTDLILILHINMDVTVCCATNMKMKKKNAHPPLLYAVETGTKPLIQCGLMPFP